MSSKTMFKMTLAAAIIAFAADAIPVQRGKYQTPEEDYTPSASSQYDSTPGKPGAGYNPNPGKGGYIPGDDDFDLPSGDDEEESFGPSPGGYGGRGSGDEDDKPYIPPSTPGKGTPNAYGNSPPGKNAYGPPSSSEYTPAGGKPPGSCTGMDCFKGPITTAPVSTRTAPVTTHGPRKPKRKCVKKKHKPPGYGKVVPPPPAYGVIPPPPVPPQVQTTTVGIITTRPPPVTTTVATTNNRTPPPPASTTPCTTTAPPGPPG
ncbi:hypothetical protein HK102_011519, partial [Quaeritorhiza haematococci]